MQGHIPALLSPLSFWLPYRELPLLTDMSHTWEDTTSSCQVRAINRDVLPNDDGDDDDEFLGCCDLPDTIPNMPKVLTMTKKSAATL